MASPTPNKGYTYPAHGGAVDAWDSPLNTNFDQIDLNVAGTYNVTLSTTTAAVTYGTTVTTAPSTVATLTFPSSIAQNLYYLLSGTITANLTMNFPAVGGIYVIKNGSSGAFSVTAANSGGGTTTTIAQNGTTIVVSEGTTGMDAANTNVVAKLYSYLGNPNGAVTGSVATSNGGVTDTTLDVSNWILYGSVSGSSWRVLAPSLPTPQTYLSPSNGTPIITGDVTSSAVYLNRFLGGWVTAPASDGLSYYPYQLLADSKLLLTNVGAADIVDVYLTQLSSLGVFLGSSPSWTVGGGSITPGSGARGAGAGSAAISRATQGFYVNTNSMTLTNGTTAVAGISAGAAILLGSVWTNAAGQTTCQRSWGQARRWGISNIYNRQNVFLKGGDATASWTYATPATWRAANNSTANNVAIFNSIAEEQAIISYGQVQLLSNSNVNAHAGIGVNSITAPSGIISYSNVVASQLSQSFAQYIMAPSLGLNTITALEYIDSATTLTGYGDENHMLLSANWRV